MVIKEAVCSNKLVISYLLLLIIGGAKNEKVSTNEN